MTLDSKPRLLLVDDEEGIREILRDFLEEQFEVFEAGSGDEAWALLQHQNVDLVISDIRMPGGTGEELLSKVRARDLSAPAFVFITGQSDFNVDEAFEKGADGFLSKPFLRDGLISTVQKFLADPQHRWSKPPSQAVSDVVVFEATSLGDAVRKGEMGIGRGGIFWKKPSPLLAPNRLVGLRFQGAEGSFGSAVVRWVRHEAANGMPAGVGLEILSLNDRVLPEWNELRSGPNVKSFIPRRLAP